MNFCTWERRHSSGCGSVTITAADTGRTATAPVIDFCDCYTGTTQERIVDLQYGVVQALGLSLSQGLYMVTVWPIDGTGPEEQQIGPMPSMASTNVSACNSSKGSTT